MLDWLIMLKITKNIYKQTKFWLTKIFSKNVVAIHEIKPDLMLDKPIYVGFSVLELSKYIMYDNNTLQLHYKNIWF